MFQLQRKTGAYIGVVIILLGFLYATLPYTIYRGWGWPNVIAWVINLVPWFNVQPSVLYQWEVKLLAHSFDIALVAFLIILGLLIHSMFSNQEDDKPKKTKDIGDINRETREYMKKLKKRGRK